MDATAVPTAGAPDADAASALPVSPTPPDRRRRRGAIMHVIASVIAAALISGLVVGLHVHAYPKLSPIDELQHVDYLFAVDDGRLARSGAKLGQRAMSEEACRGIDAAFVPPPCGLDRYDPNDFQELGWQTAGAHPPLYYGAAVLVGRAIDASSSEVESLVTGARLAGALWLGLGLLLTHLCMRQMGVGFLASWSILALFATTPAVAHAASTVNPDSMSILAGAAILAAVLRWDRAPTLGSTALVAATVLTAAFVKSMNVIVLGGVILFLLMRHLQQRPGIGSGGTIRSVLAAITSAQARLAALVSALAIGAVLGWLEIVAWRVPDTRPSGPPAPMEQAFGGKSDVPVPQLLSHTFDLFNPVAGPYVPTFIDGTVAWLSVTIIGMLIAAGLLGGAMYAPWGSRNGALIVSTAVLALVAGLVVTLGNYLLVHVFLGPLPPRYGFIYVPMIATCIALGMDRTRAIRWTSSAACLGVAALMLAELARP